jgi:hypothetical protein
MNFPFDIELINKYIVPNLSYSDRLNLSKVLKVEIITTKNNFVCEICRTNTDLLFGDLDEYPTKYKHLDDGTCDYTCYNCCSSYHDYEHDIYINCIKYTNTIKSLNLIKLFFV